jgi:hypothetical protein
MHADLDDWASTEDVQGRAFGQRREYAQDKSIYGNGTPAKPPSRSCLLSWTDATSG